MKRILALAFLAACLAVPARALIVGADVGYLTDGQDAYFAARAGEVFNTTGSVSHIAEIEIGYNSDSESGIHGTIMPVTVNYRALIGGSRSMDYYLGGGLGEARVHVSGYGLSDSDWAFAAQAFGGVSFRISDTASLEVGLRYIWIDDVEMLGTSVEMGDDLAVEGGLTFRF